MFGGEFEVIYIVEVQGYTICGIDGTVEEMSFSRRVLWVPFQRLRSFKMMGGDFLGA